MHPFLHSNYEWPKWCYSVLYAAYDYSLLSITYLMALLHSLVDGLEMKNRCRQKEGVTLRHCYLILDVKNYNLNGTFHINICLYNKLLTQLCAIRLTHANLLKLHTTYTSLQFCGKLIFNCLVQKKIGESRIWANQPIQSFFVKCLNPCLQGTNVRVVSPQPWKQPMAMVKLTNVILILTC